MGKNALEAVRWIKQAERDLGMAKTALKSRYFEHACFLSQQAAEKALKGLLYGKGFRSIPTHSVKDLYLDAKREFRDLKEMGREAIFLDKQYVPTRYPDSFDSGSPFEYFTEEDAKKCVGCAGLILSEAKRLSPK
ncbi:HEPN domain-containing protein [Candidatus Micrarchaeota archaeon]|nr:HEPN domain-containing protein [Candidatus Micrarchaeota archaeon]